MKNYIFVIDDSNFKITPWPVKISQTGKLSLSGENIISLSSEGWNLILHNTQKNAINNGFTKYLQGWKFLLKTTIRKLLKVRI